MNDKKKDEKRKEEFVREIKEQGAKTAIISAIRKETACIITSAENISAGTAPTFKKERKIIDEALERIEWLYEEKE